MQTQLLKRVPLNPLMDLKVDYAFKQLFGSERNMDITEVCSRYLDDPGGHASGVAGRDAGVTEKRRFRVKKA